MTRWISLSILIPLLLCVAAAQSSRRVIIDTDPGIDDAMAILLALNSPELKVEALTVVPGNVEAWQGLENALKIVSLAGRCDLPVAGGAQHPLNQKLITAQYWHGRNGLAEWNCLRPGAKPIRALARISLLKWFTSIRTRSR